MKKNLLPIEAIAAKLDLPEDLYEKRSPVSGKLSPGACLNDERFNRRGKLILVTAITPTTGEGKTVNTIGLTQGLVKLGNRRSLRCASRHSARCSA